MRPPTAKAGWNSWLPELFGHNKLSDRQLWWRNRCMMAVTAHELENTRIQQPKKFKPPRALKAWASLPPSEKAHPAVDDVTEEPPVV